MRKPKPRKLLGREARTGQLTALLTGHRNNGDTSITLNRLMADDRGILISLGCTVEDTPGQMGYLVSLPHGTI